MIYTELTTLAMKIAYEAHHGQVDKQGVPYIFHPIHLAEQMDTEDSCVVALLHDVVEDTDVTFEDLAEYGFTDIQIEAIRLMTHETDPSLTTDEERERDYLEYVKKIRDNPLAKKVKLADLEHNSDVSRLSLISQKEIMRNKKYEKAKMILLED